MNALFVLATLATLDAGTAREAVVPPGATAAFLVTLDGGAPFVFALSPDGQPVLARGDTFTPVKDRPERTLPTFRVTGVVAESMTFTADGALLVVSGKGLGVVGAGGFQKLVDLPVERMRVVAAGPGQALLVEGADLFRFTRGGQVEHVLRAPEPIGAVASDGERTVVAIGLALVELTGAEPRLLAAMPERVTSLALAPRGALIASSASRIDWVSEGKCTPFVKGRGGEVQVRGGDLFVLFPDEGLLKVSPLEAFSAYARRLDERHEGGRR